MKTHVGHEIETLVERRGLGGLVPAGQSHRSGRVSKWDEQRKTRDEMTDLNSWSNSISSGTNRRSNMLAVLSNSVPSHSAWMNEAAETDEKVATA